MLLFSMNEETLSQVRNMSGKIRNISGLVRNMSNTMQVKSGTCQVKSGACQVKSGTLQVITNFDNLKLFGRLTDLVTDTSVSSIEGPLHLKIHLKLVISSIGLRMTA